MVFKKTDFPKKADFKKKNFLKEKTKGSRLGTVVLFLGTVLLSALFWLKNQKGDWFKQWQEKLTQPFIYKISGRLEKKLDKQTGVKLTSENFEKL